MKKLYSSTSARFLQACAIGSCYLWLILRPQQASAAAVRALALCAKVIVPSLFPFFVCANLICALRLTDSLTHTLARMMVPCFGVPGAGAAALVLGLTGGYPAGAQAVGALYEAGSIDKRQSGKLLAFCNNCGPAFIFGVVGTTVFASPFAGFLLYAVQILSALLCGVLRRGTGSETALASAEKSASAEPPAFSAAFTASVKKAGQTVLEVCMFVTVFGVLSAMAQSALAGLLPAWAAFLPAGLLELSGGADALARAPLSQGVKFIGASFFLAFGGLSVHAQTKAVLHAAGLDALPVFVPKLLHALAAAVLSVPVYLLFQNRLDAAPAFAWSAPAGTFWVSGPVLAASVFLLFRKMAGSNLQQDRV